MLTRVIRVAPKTLRLLDHNARFMRHETFRRLVANVKRDGALTQIPFAVPTGDESQPWLVISGNHRVKAAIYADLEEIDLQVTDEVLTDDQRKAIQLAHNAITGEDDHATLKSIYESIRDLDMKEYVGLDDKMLELLEKVTTVGNLSTAIQWTVINFTFLPDEVDRLKTSFEQARALFKPGPVVAARFKDYDRFMDAVATVGTAHNVTNGATSVLVLLDLLDAHIGELQEAYLDENDEPTRHGTVPTAVAMGSVEVPVRTASLLKKVLAKTKEGSPFTPLDEALAAYIDAATE